MKNIAVIGLGAMGGSIAKWLNEEQHINVHGNDKITDQSYVDFMIKERVITKYVSLNDIVRGQYDLIILATPPEIIIDMIKFFDENNVDSYILDIGSTKRSILKAAEGLSHFVGGHPMVGTEREGLEMSNLIDFQDKSFFLIGDDISISYIKDMLSPLKANFIHTDSRDHDRLVAITSALPHILAYALMETVADNELEKVYPFIGGGLLDMTRIANSNPNLWISIMKENKDNIVPSMDSYIQVLLNYRDLLKADEFGKLYHLLENAKDIRSTLN